MKHRKLRIAWSVAWGVVAVLLVGLWVRSYWWMDGVEAPNGFQLQSLRGVFHAAPIEEFEGLATAPGYWILESIWIDEAVLESPGGLSLQAFQFRRHLILPWWSVVAVTLPFVVMPWLPIWRFSLRTLLIATTLVAVGLGLIVWVAH